MVNKLKVTRVISAFPACGKTHYYKNNNTEDFVILDSDSSEFSWVKDEDGNNTDVRNPLFMTNYINHIKSNLGKVDLIFVSTHNAVLDTLEKNNTQYTIVTPTVDLKDEWKQRFVKKGYTKETISFLSKNFESHVNILQNRYTNIIRLKNGQFIEDVIPNYFKKNEM